MGGLGAFRKGVVLSAAGLTVVAACGGKLDNSELGRAADQAWEGSTDTNAPSGQAGASPSGRGSSTPNEHTDTPPSGQAGEAPSAPHTSSDGGGGSGSGNGNGNAPLDGAQAGAGGEACVPPANPLTTCPSGGTAGAYHETGLGFFESNACEEGLVPWSSATAINAAGDVVGYASLGRRWRPILYRGGKLIELDSFPASDAAAYDINDEGEVLGNADGFAFVWNNGVTTVLTEVGHGSGGAINNLGQVLGLDDQGVYIWDAGLVIRLNLGSNVALSDLNDRGQVTGTDYDSEPGGFVWEDGVITPLPPLPGHNRSEASAINEAGQIVGASYKDGVRRAVLWDEGVPIDITPPTVYPVLFAIGNGINEHGVVIGHFEEDKPTYNHAAFVFDHGVTTLLLPEDPSGNTTVALAAINDAGEIAGSSGFWSGSPREATVYSRTCFGSCCE
jgi:uncharacterized membrane protein